MTRQLRQPFEIKSVQAAKPPSGTEGSAWCRYVITQGPNTIRGYRQGKLSTVKGEIKALVEQLNDRRSGKRKLASPGRRAKH